LAISLKRKTLEIAQYFWLWFDWGKEAMRLPEVLERVRNSCFKAANHWSSQVCFQFCLFVSLRFENFFKFEFCFFSKSFKKKAHQSE
jgi:hypothetical protein